ncbi:MAG: hypothetical protein H7Y06_05590 [Opitutaceae bacterium]|nr:hypothetical protein [Opitutaceae bacterium]
MRRPAAFLLFLAGALLPCPAFSEKTPAWPELLLPRTELAETDNALHRWRPLLPSLFPTDPALSESLVDLSSPLTPAPDAALRTWLATVQPVLSQTTLRPGERLQLPRLHGPETPFPDHQPLRQLATVRVIALKAAWAAGHHDEAVSLALENLALSRELLATQEGLIPLLNASGIWQISLDGVYWLTREPDLTPAQAATLQTALFRDQSLVVTALNRAFRGEFTFFTRLVIDRLPRTRDPELLLSSIGSLGMTTPEPPEEGEPRLTVATREIFDPEATLQAASADIHGWLTAFTATSRHPRGLTETHTYPRLLGYAREIPALLRYASQDGPPTPEQLAAANAELATVENPIGKLFLIITTSQWEPLSASVFRRESQRSALTGLLAWRRLGRPVPWKDLVTAGLLAEPPADPFSSTALRLDLKPARLWSVAANGTDEGGAGDGENFGQPADLVWPASPKR